MNPKRSSLVILAALLVTSASAYLMTPQAAATTRRTALDAAVPAQFGAWVLEPEPLAQVGLNVQADNAIKPGSREYDDVLMQTFRRSDGARVMLAIAYSKTQRQEFKIHRPELCYYGQGFEVAALGTRAIALDANSSVDSQLLLARSRSRLEPVTYWIRIGREISGSAWQTRWIIFKEGLGGRIPDGILIRASSLIQDESETESAFALQRAFLVDLYEAVSRDEKSMLAGT